MERGGIERNQKTPYSDTAVTSKSFIDPSEFPLADDLGDPELNLLKACRRSSLRQGNPQFGTSGRSSTSKAQRQTSLNSITDGSMSSGFVSDVSSATASTRYPSFSLASMDSLEALEAAWPKLADMHLPSPSGIEPTKRNKKTGSNYGQKKNKRLVDVRQRSGSMAAGTISTELQSDQHVQRSMSSSVPVLNSGTRQFNAKGNIFRQRKDFSVFKRLQAWKRNGYFIQLEDDSCTGNEDTRAFVLCQLTGHGAAEVQCLACSRLLPIYDHFPLLDGALFLSPLRHRGGLQVTWSVPLPPSVIASVGSHDGGPPTPLSAGQLMQNDLAPPPGCTGPRQQHQQQVHHHHNPPGHQRAQAPISQRRFLHAICMACMHSIETEGGDDNDAVHDSERLPQIICKFCRTTWCGSTLLIGGLYTYDLFACSPCCAEHLRCKSCGLRPLAQGNEDKDAGSVDEETNLLQPLPYFSQYSQFLCCQHCRAVDYHFIKPFDDMYDVYVPS